uniref:Uncharacterized protein n=1 Tax=Anguilla anguilla TaxID=7936 RepID=A0A0E9PUG2_ANGAN
MQGDCPLEKHNSLLGKARRQMVTTQLQLSTV